MIQGLKKSAVQLQQNTSVLNTGVDSMKTSGSGNFALSLMSPAMVGPQPDERPDMIESDPEDEEEKHADHDEEGRPKFTPV